MHASVLPFKVNFMNFFQKIFGGAKRQPEKEADDHFAEYRRELEQLNLSTLDDLENLVTPLIRDATKMVVKKPVSPPENTQLKSHFGGQPYFEAGEAWPVSGNGTPMSFIFQVFNTGNINLPDEVGLIQFYYDFEVYPWDTEDDGWLVKMYPAVNKNKMISVERPLGLDTPKYCDIEFVAIKSLPDWDGISVYSDPASKLSCILNDDEPWGAYKEVASKHVGDQDLRSQIGGYPIWLQGENTPKNSKGDYMKLLFQVDSESNADIMWGDGGLVYVFYNPDDIKITGFILQSL